MDKSIASIVYSFARNNFQMLKFNAKETRYSKKKRRKEENSIRIRDRRKKKERKEDKIE